MIAITSTVTGFVVAPNNAPMAAHTRANPMLSADDEAKAAWLAKLDAPAWRGAAKAMRSIVDEANKMSETTAPMSKEAEAKAKWLASLDVPSWGNAATAIESMVEAEQVAIVVDMPGKMSEEEAKKAWLAKLDVPVWGKISEEDAKKKWLAKLEAPVWGEAARAMITVAAEATKMAELSEDCDAGDSEACELLSKEDEAKIAWLKKLDVPSWGKTPEEQAKEKWLASLETPSWGTVAPTASAQAAALFR